MFAAACWIVWRRMAELDIPDLGDRARMVVVSARCGLAKERGAMSDWKGAGQTRIECGEQAPERGGEAAQGVPAAPEGGAAVGVKERPKQAPPRMDQLPPYRVLLHNDDVNEMDYVVETVIELARVNLSRAVEIMLTAHKRGVGLICVTHKEKAELIQEQFRSKKLVVTIEPAT